MGAELLVGDRIEDGRRLLVELVRHGFDVTAAGWLKKADGRLWRLYVGTSVMDAGESPEAYVRLYDCLDRTPGTSVGLSAVSLVPTTDPITKDLLAIRDRLPKGARGVATYAGPFVGGIEVKKARVYPRIAPELTPDEVIHTVGDLMTRPEPAEPATVTLRDGTAVRGIPFGIERTWRTGQPSGLEIKVRNDTDGSTRVIPADEVVGIQ